MTNMRNLLGLLICFTVVSRVVPQYWDMFPYLYWYYRYYQPNFHVQEYKENNARLIDDSGHLKIEVNDDYNSIYKASPPKQCYQCSSRAKDIYVYQVVKIPKTVTYKYAPRNRRTKTVFVTKLLRSKERVQGWGACQNAFPHAMSGTSDLTTVRCNNRCYTKMNEIYGVERGCLRKGDAFNTLGDGCFEDGGSTICTCSGGLCNNREAPLKK